MRVLAAVQADLDRLAAAVLEQKGVEIDRKQTDSGVYPLVLVSYLITCDTYEDQATADLVKGYASYVISEDGQKAAEEAAGSAPLTEGLRTDAQKSIDSIKAKA